MDATNGKDAMTMTPNEITEILSDRRFLDRLLVIARRNAGARNAEDARSAAILKILSMAHHYDPRKGSAEAWCVTVATRTALTVVKLDPMRKENTGEADEDGKTVSPLDNIAAPPVDDRDAEIAAMLAAISNLGPEDRALANMVAEGRGQTEIAKTLGITQGAVSKKLAKLAPKIRKAMEG